MVLRTFEAEVPQEDCLKKETMGELKHVEFGPGVTEVRAYNL